MEKIKLSIRLEFLADKGITPSKLEIDQAEDLEAENRLKSKFEGMEEFLIELDSWLAFNNSPSREQLATFRKDLKQLLTQLKDAKAH